MFWKMIFVLWHYIDPITKESFKLYDPENKYTIAFYNLENFFDTRDDSHSLDDDFTPEGFRKWNETKFRNKGHKIARAISEIGREESSRPPVLVGIAEVENKAVIASVLDNNELKEVDYDFVHFNSPDERGIDTALIYQKEHFKVLGAETLPLLVDNVNGERDFTRDILYVHGLLNHEEVHVFVNHWPSRREGAELTSYKRVKAAETILVKLANLKVENPNCIVMGDFNDDPNSESIQTLMNTGLFINPMGKLLSPISGSANYKRTWSLFDQILLSHTFLNHEPNTHSFVKAAIFSPSFLKEWKGRYKGNPFRTFAGGNYLGGYSDHFPVYVVLEKALKN